MEKNTSTCSGLGVVHHDSNRLINVPLQNGLESIIVLVLCTDRPKSLTHSLSLSLTHSLTLTHTHTILTPLMDIMKSKYGSSFA